MEIWEEQNDNYKYAYTKYQLILGHFHGFWKKHILQKKIKIKTQFDNKNFSRAVGREIYHCTPFMLPAAGRSHLWSKGGINLVVYLIFQP